MNTRHSSGIGRLGRILPILLAAAIFGGGGEGRLATAQTKPTVKTALELMNKDQFSQAEKALSEILQANPSDHKARLTLGWALWKQDRYDEALVQFKQFLRDAPAKRPPTFDETRLFGLAEPDFFAQGIDNPDIPQAKKGLGWTYFKKGWPMLARAQFEALAREFKDWDEPHLGLGWSYLVLGNFRESEIAFKQFISQTTRSRLGLNKPEEGERGLGELYLARKEYRLAIAHLERALASRPGWTDVQVNLAWSYVRAGRMADAERLFSEVGRKNPVEAEAGLGWIAMQAKRLDDAETRFGRVLAKYPWHVQALEGAQLLRKERYGALDAGWALYYQGKFAEAVNAFDALVRNPGSLPPAALPSVQNGLGWSWLAQKDRGKAQTAFQAALAKESRDAEAKAGLGWVALQEGRLEEAEKLLTEAATLVPGLQATRLGFLELRAAYYGPYDRAWELYSQGKYADAKSAFEAIVGNPNRLPPAMIPYARAGIGWATLGLGKPDEAERIFQAIRKDSPGAAGEADAGLGWVAIQRKQAGDAERLFRAALTAVPGHLGAVRGLGTLRAMVAPDLDAAWRSYYQGKYAETAPAFRKLADDAGRLADDRREALRGFGWSALFLQQTKEAAEAFEKLLQGGEDADGLEGRGLALAGLGRHADALPSFRKAVDLVPLSADYVINLGWSQLRSGDSAEALKTFLRAYGLAPASAEVNRGLGLAYARTNQPALAKAAFRYAISVAPGLVADTSFRELLGRKEYAELGMDLAWSYAQWQAFPQAERELAELSKQRPDDADVLFGLGYAQYKLNKLAQARGNLSQALKAKSAPAIRQVWVVFPAAGAYPIFADAQTILGWVELAGGDCGRASKTFSSTLESNPEMVSAMVGLAACYQKSGDLPKARNWYARAAEIYPQYPAVVTGLGATKAGQGKR